MLDNYGDNFQEPWVPINGQKQPKIAQISHTVYSKAFVTKEIFIVAKQEKKPKRLHLATIKISFVTYASEDPVIAVRNPQAKNAL